ncbi:hypothetical protein TIFTF001_005585 [Ficus carica]|uniref:Uncharacterized protein n=1 Tax=Ficus carica TaxID=3494 RepID=A0AA88CV27_FICCA|nr:hypothetical protein TIFTF001_005585 [Ficus carica]
MEKQQAKYQDNKILKFLPRAVSAVHFHHQSLPFSPNREKRFSGPIIPMIPHEARRRPKKSGGREEAEEEEPTSPKVSCIGQIKHKHKKIIKDHKKLKKRVSAQIKDSKPVTWSPRERFASGRDHSLSNFDWAAQVTPVDADHRNVHYSDDEESDQEVEIMIPFSAPIINVDRELPLQPRKEINLWKRRTMAPPRPLELVRTN